MTMTEQLYSLIIDKICAEELKLSKMSFDLKNDSKFMKMARDRFYEKEDMIGVFNTYYMFGDYIHAAEVEKKIWNMFVQEYENRDVTNFMIDDKMLDIVKNHHGLGNWFYRGHRKSLANDGSSDASKYWDEAIDMCEKFGEYDIRFFTEAGELSKNCKQYDRAVIDLFHNYKTWSKKIRDRFYEKEDIRVSMRLPDKNLLSSEINELVKGGPLKSKTLSIILDKHINNNHNFHEVYKNVIKNSLLIKRRKHPTIDLKKDIRFDMYGDDFSFIDHPVYALAHYVIGVDGGNIELNSEKIDSLVETISSLDKSIIETNYNGDHNKYIINNVQKMYDFYDLEYGKAIADFGDLISIKFPII